MPERHLTRVVAGATLAALATSVVVAAPARAEAAREPIPLSGPNSCRVEAPAGPEIPKDLWFVNRLHPERLHEAGIDGRGVTIAVIDTGVEAGRMAYWTAQNVQTQNYTEWADPKQKDRPDPFIDCVHGTVVTALIVGRRTAQTDPGGKLKPDNTNFVGMAPGATVIAMRTLRNTEQQTDEQGKSQSEAVEPILKAIDAAIEQKVRVINISQSTPTDTPAYRQKIKAAIDAGIVVVAAAGNHGEAKDGQQPGPSYPAAYPGVIAVGMTDDKDQAPAASQPATEGWQVSVAAPGVNIAAPGPSNFPATATVFRKEITGTSFAAPLVTGLVALLLQENPTMTPAQVRDRLQQTADPVASPPDKRLGYGVINPYRALYAPAGAATPAPSKKASPLPPLPPPPARPTETLRNIVLAVAGASVALALLGLVLHQALPFARRRHFRSASEDVAD